jgi:Bacterial regulatory proteins, luxR family
VVRRSRPIAVAATAFAASLVWAFAGYGDGEDVTFLLAVYSAGRYCTDRRVSLGIVAAAFATSVAGCVLDSSQRIDVWPALVFTLLPWYFGVRVRERGEYLALLRDHGLGPQPGLADVGSLVERLRTTGADVELTLADVPELPTAVDLSVFRIIQESMTNVVKHAGSRPRVNLTITHADGWLDLRVSNTVDDAAPHPDLPGSGSGIAGMRERARGATNAEISERLFIGAATVKTHVSSILTKLGLRDRAQAVVFAYESGLVAPGHLDTGF